jgi:hypothetical protein
MHSGPGPGETELSSEFGRELESGDHTGRNGLASNENFREIHLPARASSRRARAAGAGERPAPPSVRPAGTRTHSRPSGPPYPEAGFRPDHDSGRRRHLHGPARDLDAPLRRHRNDGRKGEQQQWLSPRLLHHRHDHPPRARRRLQLYRSELEQPDLRADSNIGRLRSRDLRSWGLYELTVLCRRKGRRL